MQPCRGCLTTILTFAESIHLIEGSSRAHAQPVRHKGARAAPCGRPPPRAPPSLRRKPDSSALARARWLNCASDQVLKGRSREHRAPVPHTPWQESAAGNSGDGFLLPRGPRRGSRRCPAPWRALAVPASGSGHTAGPPGRGAASGGGRPGSHSSRAAPRPHCGPGCGSRVSKASWGLRSGDQERGARPGAPTWAHPAVRPVSGCAAPVPGPGLDP